MIVYSLKFFNGIVILKKIYSKACKAFFSWQLPENMAAFEYYITNYEQKI